METATRITPKQGETLRHDAQGHFHSGLDDVTTVKVLQLLNTKSLEKELVYGGPIGLQQNALELLVRLIRCGDGVIGDGHQVLCANALFLAGTKAHHPALELVIPSSQDPLLSIQICGVLQTVDANFHPSSEVSPRGTGMGRRGLAGRVAGSDSFRPCGNDVSTRLRAAPYRGPDRHRRGADLVLGGPSHPLRRPIGGSQS
mmetsp:Transcript_99777/g.281708  ORF Transcript_99777/g.281708 Transcript_99777/m.281708 type:complete len:201 (+) Transcript_99777:2-604(+)